MRVSVCKDRRSAGHTAALSAAAIIITTTCDCPPLHVPSRKRAGPGHGPALEPVEPALRRQKPGCESVLLSGLHRKRTQDGGLGVREVAPRQHQTAGTGPAQHLRARAVSYWTTDTQPLQSGAKRSTSVIFQFTPSFASLRREAGRRHLQGRKGWGETLS